MSGDDDTTDGAGSDGEPADAVPGETEQRVGRFMVYLGAVPMLLVYIRVVENDALYYAGFVVVVVGIGLIVHAVLQRRAEERAAENDQRVEGVAASGRQSAGEPVEGVDAEDAAGSGDDVDPEEQASSGLQPPWADEP